MQVNNIINLAYSATAQAASPSAGLLTDIATPDGGLASFAGIIGGAVEQPSQLDDALLQINDPQSGIIPIPQIYGAAPPLIAPIAEAPQISTSYIDLSNGAQVEQGVLQPSFGEAVQAQNQLKLGAVQDLLQAGTLGAKFPLANEVANADDFDSELASLQKAIYQSDKQDLSAKIAALNSQAANGANTNAPTTTLNAAADAAKIQKIYDTYLSKLDKVADVVDDAVIKKDDLASLQAKFDASITNGTANANNVVGYAAVQVANKKVSDDFKDFDSKPIDVNELKLGAKFQDISQSKLEAQIKHLEDAQQVLRSPVEQVKIKIAQGIEVGQDKISIKLHPAELGKVDVEMNVDKDGKTHVRIVADRSETLDYLRRDSGELQKALRSVGVLTDDNNLQFSLNQNNGGTNGGFADNSGGGNAAPQAISEEYAAYKPQTQTEINLAIVHGGLNIVV